MYDKGLFMIYPNLPEKHVFSTNHFMKGEHPTPKYNLYHLPLLTEARAEHLRADEGRDPFEMPPLHKLQVLDIRTQLMSDLSALPHASEPFKPTPFAEA